MNDLLAATATIQGAQIQANYALWAAVIGSLGVLLSIFVAAKFTLNAHKADKLAEAKRDIYVELVASWQDFLLNINSFVNLDGESFFKNHQKSLNVLI